MESDHDYRIRIIIAGNRTIPPILSDLDQLRLHEAAGAVLDGIGAKIPLERITTPPDPFGDAVRAINAPMPSGVKPPRLSERALARLCEIKDGRRYLTERRQLADIELIDRGMVYHHSMRPHGMRTISITESGRDYFDALARST